MITNQKILEEQTGTFDNSAVDSDYDLGNSRFGIGVIMVTAGFVGIWGLLSLINGITQSQSLHDLGRGFITALTGL